MTRVAEVVGLDDDGDVELRDIFQFKVQSIATEGQVKGEFLATGYLPSFLDQFIAQGLVTEGGFL